MAPTFATMLPENRRCHHAGPLARNGADEASASSTNGVACAGRGSNDGDCSGGVTADGTEGGVLCAAVCAIGAGSGMTVTSDCTTAAAGIEGAAVAAA